VAPASEVFDPWASGLGLLFVLEGTR
jgi:hypothetical protein